ncbi:hypothetical protein WMY93_000230 [Mugilogobius chulae]|uniref:Secreted protein n=1 Tax=Mugilogobius chulae TaxID=88201 RepID=A0AAW0Q9E7_9GOBI
MGQSEVLIPSNHIRKLFTNLWALAHLISAAVLATHGHSRPLAGLKRSRSGLRGDASLVAVFHRRAIISKLLHSLISSGTGRICDGLTGISVYVKRATPIAPQSALK